MSNHWQLQALSHFFSYLFVRESKRLSSPPHSQVVRQRENPRRTPANFFLIPPELVDAILDHCDSKALHASSFVCKYWRALTIHRIFSAVELPATYAVREFAEFLRSASGVPFRGLVQSLSIATGNDSVRKPSTAAVRRLSMLLQPSALKLSIYGRNSTGFFSPRMDLGIFQKTFKTVTILELAIYFDTFIEVAKLISSFPVLEILTLDGGTGRDQVEQELPRPHISLPRTVHTIHLLAVYPTSPFLRWLCSHEHTPLVSTLTLSHEATFEAATSVFLRKLGGTLRRLTIKVLTLHSSLPGCLDLSCNSGLRMLIIHNGRRSSEITFRILSRVTSFSMEEIKFSAPGITGDPHDETFWPLLDALLAGPQFLGLRRVTVTVIPGTLHGVEARLPMLRSRGLLRFYTTWDWVLLRNW